MKLYIVGFGAGNFEGMTLQAKSVLEKCEVIVGYTVYVDLMKEYFPNAVFLTTPMKQEVQRVKLAFEQAQSGKNTALVCSGDSGVYGMSGLALQIGEEYPDVEVEIVSGVTACLSGGALLGSPLTHDFAVISLSDLMTPLEKIHKRIEYASLSDFVIVLYNPSSKKRKDYLRQACEIMLKYKSPETVCGYVRNIGRTGEESHIVTLAELQNIQTDMFTTVFIGNSETKIINGKMVTPRGYKNV